MILAELSAPRLRLIALPLDLLKKCLDDLAEVEKELGIPIFPNIVDAPVVRAINIKTAKMLADDVAHHAWYTYWLIVTKDKPCGCGFIGFKGYPDGNGVTEVGYGLDAAYWNKGYMPEALQAMRDWAFAQPQCRAITATTVVNPASARVLQKSGWHMVSKDKDETNWVIRGRD